MRRVQQVFGRSSTAMVLSVAFAISAAWVAAAGEGMPGSPEEAVAYLMFGIEDGADGSLDGGSRWKRVKSSPAVFKLGNSRLTVTRTGDCAFDIARTESDGMFRATLDLRRIDNWRVDGNDSVVEGDGLCLTTYNDCPAHRFAFQVPRIDEGRLGWEDTLRWLRANACK